MSSLLRSRRPWDHIGCSTKFYMVSMGLPKWMWRSLHRLWRSFKIDANYQLKKFQSYWLFHEIFEWYKFFSQDLESDKFFLLNLVILEKKKNFLLELRGRKLNFQQIDGVSERSVISDDSIGFIDFFHTSAWNSFIIEQTKLFK